MPTSERITDSTLCQIRRCEDNERARTLLLPRKAVIPEQHFQRGLPPPGLSPLIALAIDTMGKLCTLHTHCTTPDPAETPPDPHVQHDSV